MTEPKKKMGPPKGNQNAKKKEVRVHMSFRLTPATWAYLQAQKNPGRLIDALINPLLDKSAAPMEEKPQE